MIDKYIIVSLIIDKMWKSESSFIIDDELKKIIVKKTNEIEKNNICVLCNDFNSLYVSYSKIKNINDFWYMKDDANLLVFINNAKSQNNAYVNNIIDLFFNWIHMKNKFLSKSFSIVQFVFFFIYFFCGDKSNLSIINDNDVKSQCNFIDISVFKHINNNNEFSLNSSSDYYNNFVHLSYDEKLSLLINNNVIIPIVDDVLMMHKDEWNIFAYDVKNQDLFISQINNMSTVNVIEFYKHSNSKSFFFNFFNIYKLGVLKDIKNTNQSSNIINIIYNPYVQYNNTNQFKISNVYNSFCNNLVQFEINVIDAIQCYRFNHIEYNLLDKHTTLNNINNITNNLLINTYMKSGKFNIIGIIVAPNKLSTITKEMSIEHKYNAKKNKFIFFNNKFLKKKNKYISRLFDSFILRLYDNLQSFIDNYIINCYSYSCFIYILHKLLYRKILSFFLYNSLIILASQKLHSIEKKNNTDGKYTIDLNSITHVEKHKFSIDIKIVFAISFVLHIDDVHIVESNIHNAQNDIEISESNITCVHYSDVQNIWNYIITIDNI